MSSAGNIHKLLTAHQKCNSINLGYEKRGCEYEYGAIIGSVEIVDCVINHESIWADKSEPELWNEYGSPVYDRPIDNWVLANPILFKKPIKNVKGKLSFWDYNDITPEI